MVPVDISLFQPSSAQKADVKTGVLIVQGIGRGTKGTYAVIDGQVFREGDTKDGLTVVKINDTKVDILVNGAAESLPVE